MRLRVNKPSSGPSPGHGVRRRSLGGLGAYAMGGVGSEGNEGRGAETTGAGGVAMRDWRERQAAMMSPNDGGGGESMGGLAGGETKWAGWQRGRDEGCAESHERAEGRSMACGGCGARGDPGWCRGDRGREGSDEGEWSRAGVENRGPTSLSAPCRVASTRSLLRMRRAQEAEGVRGTRRAGWMPKSSCGAGSKWMSRRKKRRRCSRRKIQGHESKAREGEGK